MTHNERVLVRHLRLLHRRVVHLDQVSSGHDVVADQVGLVVTIESLFVFPVILRLIVTLSQEAKHTVLLLVTKHVDAVEHLAGWTVQAASNVFSESFFIDDLEGV